MMIMLRRTRGVGEHRPELAEIRGDRNGNGSKEDEGAKRRESVSRAILDRHKLQKVRQVEK